MGIEGAAGGSLPLVFMNIVLGRDPKVDLDLVGGTTYFIEPENTLRRWKHYFTKLVTDEIQDMPTHIHTYQPQVVGVGGFQ